jgi:hypothetical protein
MRGDIAVSFIARRPPPVADNRWPVWQCLLVITVLSALTWAIGTALILGLASLW